MPEPIDIVGMHGGHVYGPGAQAALAHADVVVGARRHLLDLGAEVGPGSGSKLPAAAQIVELSGDLGQQIDELGALRDSGRRVCLLVSGDPGFFGLARMAAARLGAAAVRIHPAPSSAALAFARAGVSWDDAVVVSAHGREPGPAVESVLHWPKVAVLCSPDVPPEAIGRAVTGRLGDRWVLVASRLGRPDEEVWHGDPAGLAAGTFDPLSVVLLIAPEQPDGPGWRWGRPESEYTHRAGMITKAEVRAVALGKLGLPPAGVLWDVGSGSGSVAIECARLAPGLRVFAIDRDAALLRTNVEGSDVTPVGAVTIVEGAAPAALDPLPDPDRAFVGGGGLGVLDAVLARLRPGGAVVATFASPARAAEAYDRLGHMVQVSISRATPMPGDGGMRLAAENPVFVCWGPEE
ncbi:MAG TPA: precorrin-6y C5,15-methyltransferase (decarboxylating) subunit CbiE [Acidimicrobiales bacterium]|nr:precorrin-6y C5,15-methyltransferase (decarboxylating) subunit CbiE [Acidimicrobiales bacterium]